MRLMQIFLMYVKMLVGILAHAIQRLSTAARTLAAVLILCCIAIPVSAQTLVNGGKISGAIIVAGQQNSYSFYGNANELVNLNMTDLAAEQLFPTITIYNPDGSYLAQAGQYTVASIWNLKLPQSGQYTVIVRDGSGGNANIGAYQLYFVKSVAATEHGELVNGDYRTESIEVGDIDTFFFSGSANELVNLNVTDLAAGQLFPTITIYNPDGSYLAQAGQYTVASIWNLKLPQSGQYTVVVRDGSGGHANIGDYRLYFVKSVAATEHGELLNGDYRTESIEVGDIDTFFFSGSANELVNLNVTDLAAAQLFPTITIYNPDGSYLFQAGQYTVASIWNLKLPQSGQYTVVVRDGSGGHANIGDYRLYFVKSVAATEHGELLNGDYRTESIEVGDIDTFFFSGSANELVNLNMTDLAAGQLFPTITVYNPDGSYLAQAGQYTVASIWNLKLPQSGQYTVVVRDGSGGHANIGDYRLYFVKSVAATEHGELLNGDYRTESIEVGDIDTFFFSGSANELVNLNVTDLAAAQLFPTITVYNPDGSYLAQAGQYTVASIWNLKLPQSGQYTVVVRDGSGGHANIGDYRLYFAKAPGANEHGVLSNSGTRQEVIEPGDIDSYTFVAKAGNKASFKVTDLLEGLLYPSITLYAPDGSYLTQTGGYTVAQISNYSVTVDGTYTVIIRDGSGGHANTGNYLLEFNVPNAPPSNTKPVAVVSAPASVARAEAIVLDASASYDPDNGPQTLWFDWQLIAVPAASILTETDLTGANQTMADITPDVSGEYRFNLTIGDGIETDSAEVMVVATNGIPLANAGVDINSRLGGLITLDGSASSDADGDLLSYQWQLTSAPENSMLSGLANDNSVTPSFTPDVAGIYSIQLIVNDGENDSVADAVNVSVSLANVAPNLSALASGNLLPGEIITLDASASVDPDNGPQALSYLWSLNNKPVGSNLDNDSISNASGSISSFVPDLAGLYEFTLSGSDSEATSVLVLAVTIQQPASNLAPTANAGDDFSIELGEQAWLDGNASQDDDNGPLPLTYSWRFTSVPADSNLNAESINDANSASASFTPDVTGTYVLTLTVFDGETSATDTLRVTVNAQVQQPLTCDVNGDFNIDSSDIALIMARRNQPATAPIDLADWNNDGVINVLDARGCTLQCTNPKCARQ